MKRTDYVTPLTIVLEIQDADVIRTSMEVNDGIIGGENELPAIIFK